MLVGEDKKPLFESSTWATSTSTTDTLNQCMQNIKVDIENARQSYSRRLPEVLFLAILPFLEDTERAVQARVCKLGIILCKRQNNLKSNTESLDAACVSYNNVCTSFDSTFLSDQKTTLHHVCLW